MASGATIKRRARTFILSKGSSFVQVRLVRVLGDGGVVRHDESNEAFEGMRGAMHQGCSRFRSKIPILVFARICMK